MSTPPTSDTVASLRVKTRDASARVARVPLDRVRFHPANIRRDLGDLTELIASIQAHGILQALVAERRGDTLQLLMGHRRLAAAHAAGLKTVPVMVVRHHAEDEATLLMLAENTQRAGLSRQDRAAALRDLVHNHRYTRTSVAEHLGVSVGTVSRWMGEEQPAPERRRPAAHRASRTRPPVIAPKAVHALLVRYGGAAAIDPLAAAALLAELRDLLAGWAPPTATADRAAS